MSWIQIVLWIITNAPEIISLVKQILNLINPSDPKLGLLKHAIIAGINNNDVGAVKKAIGDCHSSLGCLPDLAKE